MEDPGAPAITVSEEGATARVKSAGGGVMVTLTDELCESVPALPLRVRAAEPAAAEESAAMLRFCATPGVRVSVVGETVTPDGMPETLTDTLPMKPLEGAALTLICCGAPPGVRAIVPGLAAIVKSAVGPVFPLLQETEARITNVVRAAGNHFAYETI
jgi:hypothetical protein